MIVMLMIVMMLITTHDYFNKFDFILFEKVKISLALIRLNYNKTKQIHIHETYVA